MKIDLAVLLDLADECELNNEERREVHLPTETKIDNKKCLNCGKSIIGMPYNSKFCSPRCGARFRYAKRKSFIKNSWGVVE